METTDRLLGDAMTGGGVDDEMRREGEELFRLES